MDYPGAGSFSFHNGDLDDEYYREGIYVGFEGLVMTDWGTTGSIDMEPGKQFKYGHSNAAGCVWAGNDLNMPGSKEDIEEILRSVGAKEGEVSYPLTKADLQACAKRVLSVVMKSAVYR